MLLLLAAAVAAWRCSATEKTRMQLYLIGKKKLRKETRSLLSTQWLTRPISVYFFAPQASVCFSIPCASHESEGEREKKKKKEKNSPAPALPQALILNLRFHFAMEHCIRTSFFLFSLLKRRVVNLSQPALHLQFRYKCC